MYVFYGLKGWVTLPAEKAMAPHSSTLAWKILWMEEPGRLQSMGSLRVGHDWDFTVTFHVHALVKEMVTHSSALAWRIPGTGKPGELLSMGSHRVGHDWRDLAAAAAAAMHLGLIFAVFLEVVLSRAVSWFPSSLNAEDVRCRSFLGPQYVILANRKLVKVVWTTTTTTKYIISHEEESGGQAVSGLVNSGASSSSPWVSSDFLLCFHHTLVCPFRQVCLMITKWLPNPRNHLQTSMTRGRKR